MSLEIDNINVGGTLSATTVSATTIVMGSQTLQQIFAPSTPGGYLPISGGTVTGETIFIAGLSANTLSGGTLYGDGSNLTGVGNVVSASLTWKFSTAITNSDPGSGKFKYNNATPLNVSEIYIDYITENGIDANLILNRIKSNTQIYIQQRDDSSKATLFNVTADTIDNTGWVTVPVSVVSDAGGGVPGNNKGCIFVAILQTPTGGTGTSTYVQPGSNITTGGTATSPIINLTASPSVNSITSSGASSFTTLTATTFISGSTNLYDIFLTTNDGNDITRVQPGTNITTGGTATSPIINLTDSPSVNNITFSGTATGGNLSAVTVSAETIYSGSTNLYSIFAPIGGGGGGSTTYVQPGLNTYTGGTALNPTVNISAATLTYLSATTISGGTLYSGSTNLHDIFAPIGGGGGGSTTYVQPGTNITTGGTATNPIINIVDSPSFNSVTASGASSFTTLSATTLFSGSTNLYSIFATIPDQNDVTRVQPGTNITTGGTANLPTVNLVASPSVNNLTISGLTSSSDGATFSSLSGTNIFSGSTNLQTYFTQINQQLAGKANDSGDTFTGTINTPSLSATTLSGGTIFSGNTNLQTYFTLLNQQDLTKANLSGATFTGTVNATTLSATTLSANTSVFVSGFKFPVSPVSGYILTSDASGNASWAVSPTSGSGTTKLDMQTFQTGNTISVTTTLVDLATLTAKNLGSSATTYQIFYNANFNNNNAGGNTAIRVMVNSTEITNARTVYTNAATQMASFRQNASSLAFITGVTNGDIIKIQMSAQTGTASVSGRTLSIIGTLTTNLV